jgi:hypothetical protein
MNEKKATRYRAERKETRTFRLSADEIAFLESLSNKNITGGLRKLITFGRAVGSSSNMMQPCGADITLALIARVERLERLNVNAVQESP